VLRDIGKNIALFEGFQTQPLVFMVRVVFVVEMSMERWWNGVYRVETDVLFTWRKICLRSLSGFSPYTSVLPFQYHFTSAA